MVAQSLWAFWNYNPDNLVELLPLAKFTYHKVIDISTRKALFLANSNCNLVMQFMALKQPSNLKSEIQADTLATCLEQTRQPLWQKLQEAEGHQIQHVGRTEDACQMQIMSCQQCSSCG